MSALRRITHRNQDGANNWDFYAQLHHMEVHRLYVP
jgi:hypothetical protein